MGGGPDAVDRLEERPWGLFADYSRAPAEGPTTSRASARLRKEWARNRFLIRLIAGAGWLVPREGSNGKPSGGTIVDPVGVARTERDAQLEILRRTLSPTDPDRHRLFTAVWNEYFEKMDALRERTPEDESKRVYWAQIQEDVARQIAEETKRIDEMEVHLAVSKVELRTLEESDGRTPGEQAAGEPAHPPYKRIQDTRQEILELQDEIAAEKRYRKALEDDAVRLEEERSAGDAVDDPQRGGPSSP